MMRFARSRFAVMSVSVPCSAPLRLRYGYTVLLMYILLYSILYRLLLLYNYGLRTRVLYSI